MTGQALERALGRNPRQMAAKPKSTEFLEAVRRLVERGELVETDTPGVYARPETPKPAAKQMYTMSAPHKMAGSPAKPLSAAQLQKAQRYKRFGLKYRPMQVSSHGHPAPQAKPPKAPKAALKPPAGKGGAEWCKLRDDARRDGFPNPEKYADAMLRSRESYAKIKAERRTIARTNKVAPR